MADSSDIYEQLKNSLLSQATKLNDKTLNDQGTTLKDSAETDLLTSFTNLTDIRKTANENMNKLYTKRLGIYENLVTGELANYYLTNSLADFKILKDYTSLASMLDMSLGSALSNAMANLSTTLIQIQQNLGTSSDISSENATSIKKDSEYFNKVYLKLLDTFKYDSETKLNTNTIDYSNTALSYSSDSYKLIDSSGNSLNQSFILEDNNGLSLNYSGDIAFSDDYNFIANPVSSSSITLNLNFLKPYKIENGTESYPYLIYTADDFLKILTETTEGKYYKLMADISLMTDDILTSNSFSGTLDGNYHIIKSNYAFIKHLYGTINHTEMHIVASDKFYIAAMATGWMNIESGGTISNCKIVFDSFNGTIYRKTLLGYELITLSGGKIENTDIIFSDSYPLLNTGDNKIKIKILGNGTLKDIYIYNTKNADITIYISDDIKNNSKTSNLYYSYYNSGSTIKKATNNNSDFVLIDPSTDPYYLASNAKPIISVKTIQISNNELKLSEQESTEDSLLSTSLNNSTVYKIYKTSGIIKTSVSSDTPYDIVILLKYENKKIFYELSIGLTGLPIFDTTGYLSQNGVTNIASLIYKYDVLLAFARLNLLYTTDISSINKDRLSYEIINLSDTQKAISNYLDTFSTVISEKASNILSYTTTYITLQSYRKSNDAAYDETYTSLIDSNFSSLNDTFSSMTTLSSISSNYLTETMTTASDYITAISSNITTVIQEAVAGIKKIDRFYDLENVYFPDTNDITSSLESMITSVFEADNQVSNGTYTFFHLPDYLRDFDTFKEFFSSSYTGSDYMLLKLYIAQELGLNLNGYGLTKEDDISSAYIALENDMLISAIKAKCFISIFSDNLIYALQREDDLYTKLGLKVKEDYNSENLNSGIITIVPGFKDFDYIYLTDIIKKLEAKIISSDNTTTPATYSISIDSNAIITALTKEKFNYIEFMLTKGLFENKATLAQKILELKSLLPTKEINFRTLVFGYCFYYLLSLIQQVNDETKFIDNADMEEKLFGKQIDDEISAYLEEIAIYKYVWQFYFNSGSSILLYMKDASSAFLKNITNSEKNYSTKNYSDATAAKDLLNNLVDIITGLIVKVESYVVK
jgi:hypothetical protein